MSTAGVFYALAVYVATRECVSRFKIPGYRPLVTAAVVIMLAAGSALPMRAVAAPGDREVVIPDNTVVRLKLEDRVSSKENRRGHRFAAV